MNGKQKLLQQAKLRLWHFSEYISKKRLAFQWNHLYGHILNISCPSLVIIIETTQKKRFFITFYSSLLIMHIIFTPFCVHICYECCLLNIQQILLIVFSVIFLMFNYTYEYVLTNNNANLLIFFFFFLYYARCCYRCYCIITQYNLWNLIKYSRFVSTDNHVTT